MSIVGHHGLLLAGRRDRSLVWTAHAGSSAGAWESICWSPELGLFVAVGNNAISTSSDGINWTARTSPINSHWRSITWSPELGLFVAVASTGAGWAMRSSDGINWTANIGSVTSQWRSITWSPELGLFVAVASFGSNRVLTSVNGSTWASNNGIGTLSQWEDVAWSPDLGLFFAVAVDDPGTHWSAYSSNGTVWTTQTPGVTSAWRDVIWASGLGGGGAFVAIASEGYTAANQRVVISPDAISWDLFAGSTTGGAWRGVAWAQSVGILAAVASSGSSRIMTSYNGMDWISFAGPAASDWRSICWSPELVRFVAVASSGSNRALVGRFN